MVLNIIWMIILGLIVGWIARLIVPGKENFGWIATALLGIIGGYVGGTLGSLVFAPHKFTVTPPINHAFLGALVGAVILLVAYKFIARPKASFGDTAGPELPPVRWLGPSTTRAIAHFTVGFTANRR